MVQNSDAGDYTLNCKYVKAPLLMQTKIIKNPLPCHDSKQLMLNYMFMCSCWKLVVKWWYLCYSTKLTKLFSFFTSYHIVVDMYINIKDEDEVTLHDLTINMSFIIKFREELDFIFSANRGNYQNLNFERVTVGSMKRNHNHNINKLTILHMIWPGNNTCISN